MTSRTTDIAGGATGLHAVAVPRTGRRVLAALLGATLLAGLTIVGANIRIPLQPVPITLQTLFVVLAGAVLLSVKFSL